MSSAAPWAAVPAFVLLIAAPEPVQAQEKSAVSIQKQLRNQVKFPGIADPNTTLDDALAMINERYCLKVEVNDRAFQDDGVQEVRKAEIATPNPIAPGTCTLDTVLKKLAARIPSTSPPVYVIRRDHVELTTQDALKQEFYPQRAENDHPQLVVASFKKVALEEALDQLAEAHDVNIVVDARVGEAAKTLIRADLFNVPLDTAVRLLADMAGLKAVQIDKVVYVTTPANAAVLQKEEKRKQPRPFDPTIPGIMGFPRNPLRGF
jgi:hypothetical protein